jgi:hypothetical protein
MIDFENELKKFEPVANIEDANCLLEVYELKDLVDIINYITNKYVI